MVTFKNSVTWPFFFSFTMVNVFCFHLHASEGSPNSTAIPKPKPLPKNAMQGVRIPPPKKRASLVLVLPESLPASKVTSVVKSVDQIHLDLSRFQFPKASEYLGYYVSEQPIQGSGKVTGTELDMGSAGDYQYIYVKLSAPTAEKKFSVQKNLAEIEDPQNKGRKAQMIQLQGEIQILDVVNDSENIYRAMVTKTIHPVEVGSVLVPGAMPMIDPEGGSPSSGVSARIMGGQFDKKRTLMGQNSIVFLDAGSSQGLKNDQTLSIMANERLRNKNSNAVMNDRVIGSLKIVNVSEGFATAYVSKASDDILVGDHVGSAMNSRSSQAVDAAPDSSAPPSGNEDSDLEL